MVNVSYIDMDMHTRPGIGIDIEDIARFRVLLKQKGASALKRLFTEAERAYCFSFRDPAPHFAGFFAAKEAASKALGVRKFPFMLLEIRHSDDGAPQVWRDGRRARVRISITHTRTVAAAMALV